MAEIIIQKGVKDLTELQALAYGQKQEGKTDLAEFLISHAPGVVTDILNSAWEIETAQQKLAHSKKTRMELLQEGRSGECVEGCNGEWLTCAQEILQNNSVPSRRFENSVIELLTKGRGKYRNIMIVGPANCDCNPASGSFAWVGVDKAECIFLNDFRWSPHILP